VELREILAALRAGWWLAVIGLVVGAGAALLASLLQTPLYTSSTQLFVSTRDSASSSEVFQGSQFSQQRVTSYAQLITGDELADRVIDRLNLDMATSTLRDKIVATTATNTVLIDVTVTDPSPERAQRIADAVGDEFASFATELETTDPGGPSPVKVTVTQRPQVPSVASSPRTTRNAALGALAGLFVGAGLAIARARLDRTVKEADDATELAGAPVIGLVLRDQSLEKRHVIERGTPTRVAEDYRQLRTNLQFLNVDNPPKVIMVSSAMPAEGKTTAAINLALALAEAGRQVTLLDADLRRPRVTNYLGVVGGVGLTNVLAGTADVADVLQPYGDTGVQVIGAGPTPPNPSELLASKHMSALIHELRGKSEYVLIDAPPLLPVADSTGLAVMVDGVLLSVRYGKSRKDQLQQAAATLERVGARTLGLILNMVPPKAGVTAAYGYGYTYGEDKFGLAAPERRNRRRAK
jgi:capsular exopolysaccharide synthesis family protein